MHELGIVFYIIRDVRKAAEENHVSRVSAVVMDIGEVSTMVPEYLMDCWRWAADKEDLLRGAELRINTLSAVSFCGNCGKPSPQMQAQQTPQPQPVPQPAGQPAGGARAFMRCPYCGEDLSSLKKTPKFCPYCAEELS